MTSKTSKGEFRIEPFDPATASDEEWRARYDLALESSREEWPEDPPTIFEELVKDLKFELSFRKNLRWLVWDQDRTRPLACADLSLKYIETNRHLAWAGAYVRPDARRQGIGRALVGKMAEVAREDGRTVLGFGAIEDLDGPKFLGAMGAERRSVERKSRMVMAEVDRSMLEEWVRKAEERAGEYSLVSWDGPCADELLEPFSKLFEVMNTAPRDDLDMEDEPMTPERMRERETRSAADGYNWWTLVARHDPTGELAGFTEFHFSPHHDDIAWQGNTGVDPTHRNKGLGRWLKAANCLRLMDEHPDVRYVDTWNAFSNDPMLAINIAMGFKLVKGIGDYQIDIDKALAFAQG